MKWPQSSSEPEVQVQTETTSCPSLEFTKSAFQARAIPYPGAWVPLSLFSPASQLSYIIRMLFGYMPLPAAPNAEKRFRSEQIICHSRSFLANPKKENLIGLALSWLGSPSAKCPIVKRNVVQTSQPAEFQGKNQTKEVWQLTRTGLPGNICYYLQYIKMCHCPD